MVELSRRFFLGGAIALLAVETFKPVSASSNLPTIYGNGKNDDSYGIGALLRNEPVIFNKDQIGVNSHKGVIFHKGRFLIEKTINISEDAQLIIEDPEFIQGKELTSEFPFFRCLPGFKWPKNGGTFTVHDHVGKLVVTERVLELGDNGRYSVLF